MSPQPAEIISRLQLAPLPHEGGFFRQTWRSEAGSAIVYLMTEAGFSALHRLRTDELWHFYAGDAVEHVQLDPRTGDRTRTRLGGNVLAGEAPQLLVPANVWQGARIEVSAVAAGYALLGMTLAPPWQEREFELANRETLSAEFSSHREIIRALTR